MISIDRNIADSPFARVNFDITEQYGACNERFKIPGHCLPANHSIITEQVQVKSGSVSGDDARLQSARLITNLGLCSLSWANMILQVDYYDWLWNLSPETPITMKEKGPFLSKSW